MKEKFLKVIEDNWHDGDTAFKDIANQCTRINIEEKIELLKTMYASYSHSEPRHDYNKGYFDCQRNTDKFIDKLISELTNELKKL